MPHAEGTGSGVKYTTKGEAVAKPGMRTGELGGLVNPKNADSKHLEAHDPKADEVIGLRKPQR